MWQAIGAIAAPILGGLAGELWARSDDKERERLMREAEAIYGDASAPNLERLIAEQMGPSAMEGVQVDAESRGLRREALRALMEEGRSGGQSLESRAALETAKRTSATQERGQREAIVASARARGQSGGGQELLAQMKSQQAGADRMGAEAIQSAADERRRALQALAQGGDMAGQLERDDFGQNASKAQASDAIARFNAANRQQASVYNAQLGQQQFDNELALKDRQYGAKQDAAGYSAEKARRKRQLAGGLGQGAAQGIGGWKGGGTP